MSAMFSEKYRFGGVTYAVECAEDIERSDMCAAFVTETGAAEHTIRLQFSDKLPEIPDGAFAHGPIRRWYEKDARHTLQCYSAAGKTPQFTYAVTRGGLTELRFSESYRHGASVRSVLESACLFDLMADAGMLILHSAYIVTPGGEAILFSGSSGIGKSTQAALWEKYAAARVINGDRSLINPAGRTVHGIFYSGTSGICKNVSAPLRAIVLLGQAVENRLYPAEPKDAFARVLSQCAYYEWDTPSAIRMTDFAAQLVSNVPVLRFDCLADESAVRVLQEYLGGS